MHRNIPSRLIRASAIVVLAGSGCRMASEVPPTIIGPSTGARDLFVAQSTRGAIELSLGFSASQTISARMSSGEAPAVTWRSADPTIADVTPIDGHSANLAGHTTIATLRNTGSSDRAIQLGACSVWITLHGGGSWYYHEMRPLYWDQTLGTAACTDTPKTVTLPPRASYTATTSVFAADLLATISANSRYFFHAHVRFDTTQVVVGGDSAVITYPSSDLSPVAATVILGSDTAQTLKTTATLTNRGELPAYVEHGSCDVRVLAYNNTQRSGSPVWDSNLRGSWAGYFGYACTMELRSQTLAPGASMTSSFQGPLIEMLADSLPDGRYYFTADFALQNRPSVVGIPAGSADLVLPRATLPATRAANSLTYRASPVTIEGSPRVVRATVTATLTFAGGALVNFSHDCPLVLYAYRDRARRAGAPRSGAADWSQPLSCGTQNDQVVMNRGNARTFETTARVSDILGASLPAGRYYFAVAVHAQGNRVMLSAGEADLSR